MRIVLVEDSARVVEVVSAALTSAGHTVRVASTLAKARTTCATRFRRLSKSGSFPQVDARALCRGMRELQSNAGYLCSLYSRQVTPRTFARFDSHPEFALLARTLPGYRSPGSA